MKKLICFLSLFVSLSAFALDGHPYGDCAFITKWDDLINLFGKVRIVDKHADIIVHVWHPGDDVSEDVPIIFIKVIKSEPSKFWCCEFLLVKSGEDFTVKLVDDPNKADMIVKFGNPRIIYPDRIISYPHLNMPR